MKSSAMRVLLHYAAGPEWRRRLAALAAEGIAVDCCAAEDEAGFQAALPQADVLWHVLRPLSADDIARAKRLRLIQKIGVGVNTIDLAAAKARGIAICNMPGTNSRAVAEMTLLLMLACLRRLPLLDRAVRAGAGWRLDPALQDGFGELAGCAIGLLGYGAVPQCLTPILLAMGARPAYWATAPKPEVAIPFRPFETLLETSDIVSLHLPLTPATRGIIDAAALARMRPCAILINTARGELVDTAALHAALKSGRLRGAGFDVFGHEPVPADDPLLSLDTVVLAPHLAWLTAGTLERSLAVAVENCRRLARGAPLLHQVG